MARRLGTGLQARAAALLAALIALSNCDEQNAYVPPPPPQVTVAKPATRTITQYLLATGNTAAVNTADLMARIPGFVVDINYEDGDFVKKGTVLFTIEPGPYALKVEQAKAAEASARASLVNAEANYSRQADLAARGTASKAALDDAISTRDSARASLDQAVASTKLAENDYSYTSVGAPFDGIVMARTVSTGAYVGSSPTTLATIVQIDPIYVNFNIGEQDVIRIRERIRKHGLKPEDLKKVQVEIGLQTDKGYPHAGHLDYASPILDSSTGTLAARAVLNNSQRVLLPGMFVRVRVPIGREENALLVPDSALGNGQSGRYVLVVGADNVVEQRKVEIGQLEGTLRVIESGLKADDQVIVTGLLRAVPGQKVSPRSADAAPDAK